MSESQAGSATEVGRLSLKATYKVLVLGSSDITASESGESATLPYLLRKELERRFPEATWCVESAMLYPMANMAGRVEAGIERVRPDVVHLTMGANTFIEKTVLFSIRRRWPWAYRAASGVFGAVKGVAGGGTEGSPSARGAIFRVPRGVGRRVFGMASMLEPETALDATRQAFAMLASKGTPVVVRLAEGGVQQKDQREAARKITDAYNAEVRAMCERSGFPVFRLSEELGHRYGRTPDGLHADLPTRIYGAARTADLVVAALELEGAAPSPPAAGS